MLKFRDRKQRARVCRKLAAMVGRGEQWWAEEGPTDEARRLLETDGDGLSERRRAMLLLSWRVWLDEGAPEEVERLPSFDVSTLGPEITERFNQVMTEALMAGMGIGKSGSDLTSRFDEIEWWCNAQKNFPWDPEEG